MSLPIEKAILRRRSVAASAIFGIGPFDDNGERDVTLWAERMEFMPAPGDGVVIYAKVAGVRTVILRTCRLGRSDDALRLMALEEFASKSGTDLEVTHPAPAPAPKKKAKE